jgi:hypothetical protein
VDLMAIQSQLSIKTHKAVNIKPKIMPNHLLNWEREKKPKVKTYILLHVIQAITEHPNDCQSIEGLVATINTNTKSKRQKSYGVAKKELKLFIETLIYLGFIDDSYNRGLILNDKIYDELESIDKIINGNSQEVGK